MPVSHAHFYGLWEWDSPSLGDTLHHIENKPHPPLSAFACALPSGPVAFCRDDHWTLNVLYALMMPMYLNTCPGHGRGCDGGCVLFVNRGLGILACLLVLCHESCYGNLSVFSDEKNYLHAI